MSEEDLKAELERLRNENASLKKGRRNRHQNEGERKGCRIHLWHGSLSGNFVQRAVAEAVGYVARNPELHFGERRASKDEGVT